MVELLLMCMYTEQMRDFAMQQNVAVRVCAAIPCYDGIAAIGRNRPLTLLLCVYYACVTQQKSHRRTGYTHKTYGYFRTTYLPGVFDHRPGQYEY